MKFELLLLVTVRRSSSIAGRRRRAGINVSTFSLFTHTSHFALLPERDSISLATENKTAFPL